MMGLGLLFGPGSFLRPLNEIPEERVGEKGPQTRSPVNNVPTTESGDTAGSRAAKWEVGFVLEDKCVHIGEGGPWSRDQRKTVPHLGHQGPAGLHAV